MPAVFKSALNQSLRVRGQVSDMARETNKSPDEEIALTMEEVLARLRKAFYDEADGADAASQEPAAPDKSARPT